MAEKTDRAAKYYADIERGSCGMSVETLMALSEALDMSLDYIIYGKEMESGYPQGCYWATCRLSECCLSGFIRDSER